MLSAKTTSPCSYYSFGNFVNEAGRGPIEFQFTANFLQMLEKFCSRSRKVAKNACWALLFVSRGWIGGPLVMGRPRLNPFALAHQWFGCAVGVHSVHIHLAGANHPVHMDQAGICTQRRQLLRIHLLAADNACG